MSRDTILAAIRAGRPAEVAHPGVPATRANPATDWNDFAASLATAGGSFDAVPTPSDLGRRIAERYAEARRVLSAVPDVPSVGPARGDPRQALAALDLCVVPGVFAVAENGAVWVTGDALSDPAALFLCEALAVVVPAAALVPDLHAAYARLRSLPPPRWASFIAGPSKTADIEQCLVIGAHGPRRLTVFAVG